MNYTSRAVYEFISTQNNDPIVEWKTCMVSGQPFAIYQSDLDFYNKISPTFAGQKFQIPTPTLCPEERQRRRLAFRNERKLYKRKCDATGDSIVSIYSPEKVYKVYNQDFRWSDLRDPSHYTTDYNYDSTFFSQFMKLNEAMPKRALVKWTGSENCDYVNWVGASKNCYFIFDSSEDTDCFFGNTVVSCNNCCDMSVTKKSEQCYELIDCINCYNVYYSQNSIDCKYSRFLLECNDCEFCFACIGLSHKKYCIYNQQYTKEQYEQKIEALSLEYTIDQFMLFTKDFPLRSNKVINCDHARWNMLYNSSYITYWFEISDATNISYSSTIFNNSHDNHDTHICINNSCQNYEWLIINKNCFHLLFCMDCRNNCSDLLYCMECKLCKNCFGCTWLVNKEYCILNKQYSKEEYNLTVSKIISHMQDTGEWWQFFSPSISAFGYNETTANEYFPCASEDWKILLKTSKAALESSSFLINLKVFWYKRQDNNYDPIIPEGAKVIDWKKEWSTSLSLAANNELPKGENILNAIFVCEVSWRPYRIIKQELEFYKKYNLPLPRKHPDIRHEERMRLRPGRTLYLRNCDKCQTETLSIYPNTHPWTIYCEMCYQQEVYS